MVMPVNYTLKRLLPGTFVIIVTVIKDYSHYIKKDQIAVLVLITDIWNISLLGL